MEDAFELEYERFKKDVKVLIGVDLNQYKSAQMKRRIKAFIVKYNLSTLMAFVDLLRKNEEVLCAFKDYITINVTEFFRNPEKFEELRLKIIPEIIKNSKAQGRRILNIWSAGCSTGAEAYSLAIIMMEHFPGQEYSISGTDIDVNIVKSAKLGEYRDIEVKNISKPLMTKYFKVFPDRNRWQVNDIVKQKVKFSISNLLQDNFQKGFDLIMCRNVVIYFTEEAKELLYKKFFDSLYENGVLFIGGTESILNARQIGFRSNANLFYHK